MATSLQNRAGKNASPKPFGSATVMYGPPKGYVLDQSLGTQLLIPGPPSPGSGSKNLPPRAQDTEGQFDLGVERYMGARTRSLMTQCPSFGTVYGIVGAGATGVGGDVVLVRPNGKAIVVGSIPLTGAAEASSAKDSGALGPSMFLAPGEDLVFVPKTSVSGTALFVPAFVDTDLIGLRIPLVATKQDVLVPPPGKVWYLAPGCGSGYGGYSHSGGCGNFDGENWCFFLPGGLKLKASIDSGSPITDIFFCAVMAEYNQAETDEEFVAPTGTPFIPPVT